MLIDPSPDIQSALRLISRGRFVETVVFLQKILRKALHTSRVDPHAFGVLADALQRIGQNDDAETMATRHLTRLRNLPIPSARCHFALGNVHRDRGRLDKAYRHLQLAVELGNDDPELLGWALLRLIVVLGELEGIQAALARMDETRQILTRCGDPRLFAALHLWMSEAESMRGDLESARRHIKISESLLSGIDDVWLAGYLAINQSAVHYYSAEISEAQHSAEIAIALANQSGHRPTLRAAHTNLGNIQLSRGEFQTAEESFTHALNCCESGSVHEMAILDNLAQVKLQSGSFEECRKLLETCDTRLKHHAKRKHYLTCALLTRARLLLAEGRKIDALRISEEVVRLIDRSPESRISIEANLQIAEAFLANEDFEKAANSLISALSSVASISLDLLARSEMVCGDTFAFGGSPARARQHYQRANRIFSLVGHTLGETRSATSLDNLFTAPSTLFKEERVHLFLDRIRALLDLRNRPELFGYEATALLQDLECASDIKLVVDDLGKVDARAALDISSQPNAPNSIALATNTGRHVTLIYTPRNQPQSKLLASSFRKIITRILDKGPRTVLNSQDALWSIPEDTPVQHGVVFASQAMRGVLRIVKQIAPTDVAVLITGETGTGKEVVARTVHEQSRRSGTPLVALNCAAVPKDLLESQLFGHRKGAFSGAAENFQGVVRAANGGTLLLDEIGDIPLDVQAKLLRFLEMREVHPVGEPHPVKVNVRLLFATNGDLEEAVRQNRFRQDLYYRLNVVPIKIPPLRERREEIPVLANLFAQQFAAEFSKEPVRFSASAMELLIVHSWPGNVRQLANEIRRIAALCEPGACVTPEHLSPPLRATSSRPVLDAASPHQVTLRMDQSLAQATAHLEKEMIGYALRSSGGRVAGAASTLGISRKGLYLKRLRLGLIASGHQAH